MGNQQPSTNEQPSTEAARSAAEELLSDGEGKYKFYPHGLVEEIVEGSWQQGNTKKTAVGEWLVEQAVARGEEVDPVKIADISFQLGKLVGRKGFVEILN